MKSPTYHSCMVLSVLFAAGSFVTSLALVSHATELALAIAALSFAFAIGAHLKIGRHKRRRFAVVVWMVIVILWSLLLIGV